MTVGRIIHKLLFGGQVIKARLLKQYIPFYVSLFLTKNCNFKCIYCVGRYGRYQKEKDLSLDQIKFIIDEFKNGGTKRMCLVGGEPLLRDDIGEIIEYIRYNEIAVSLTTNGRLIKKRLNQIKRLNHLYVSLDGDKKGHELNRGKNFERVMDGINAAVKYVPVGIVTVMTKYNLHSLDYLVNFAKEKNLSLFIYTAMNQVDNDKGKVTIEALPTKEEHRALLTKIIAYIKEGAPIRASTRVYEISLNWPDYKKDVYLLNEPKFNYIKCYAGKYHCAIDPEGFIYPCARMVGVDKPLSIFTDGFEKAWKKVNNHYCRACRIECHNEMNLLFSFNINVLLNAFKLVERKET